MTLRSSRHTPSFLSTTTSSTSSPVLIRDPSRPRPQPSSWAYPLWVSVSEENVVGWTKSYLFWGAGLSSSSAAAFLPFAVLVAFFTLGSAASASLPDSSW
jgi:hypothetical protein